jgi:hypothetical protein
LRRLLPDRELFERRAAEESLRALAVDYGVVHTSLSRYFARPEVALELRAAGRRLRLERAARRRALLAERAEERRLERQVRVQAKQQAVLTRAELRSRNDQLAAQAVAAGGGVEAVIEATGLRTRVNVLRLIDPLILVQALDNDAASAAAVAARERLRQLRPDPQLLRRRAAGESLRRIAADYAVAHTTLYRHFQRPQVARHLKQAKQRAPAKKVA